MLNRDIWNDIDKRKRALNPIFLFGSGMNVGDSLQPYIRDILLSVLLEVYYRELRDDEGRTKEDVFQIVNEVLNTFSFDYKEEDINRLGNGLFYSGDSKRMDSFKGYFYNPKMHLFEEQRFSYLEQDREYTKIRKGMVVYKLTDESIRMILMSREFEEEMDMSVEQLYTLQLIKAGRVNQAISVLDALSLRIRRVLLKEKEYRYELERNPKILLTNRDVRRSLKEDIRRQSEEAQELYQRMHGTLAIIEKGDEISRIEHLELENKINSTSRLHLQLSDEVYKNIAFELDIRKNNPLALVYRKTANFYEEIWKKEIFQEGVPSDEIYDFVLGPLFSPKQDVIFPMDWIWQEQELQQDREYEETLLSDIEEEVSQRYYHEINWEKTVADWHPIFKELAIHGVYELKDLQGFDQWKRDSIDFWSLFTQGEFEIHKTQENLKYNDERMTFFQKLISFDKEMCFFEGKTLIGALDSNEQIISEKVRMSSFTLRLKGE
ncbi:hypothetical protein [Paenibacillus sp. L3-i20]|uniref:hypothetical protein n=1 Tax=Paenibacillus sp. L3-i20 TaxID=2905833 RepID=UPI001EDFB9B8|nr:hypothetical protein [Paenibacillus sp. L3-i20]GKU76624.1 hypothetical protein L3i20_v210210 [Paenibacillus sp. L3-i20]